MCVTLLREIQQLTELEIPELASSTSSSSTTTTTATTTTHPLLSLIASHASNGKLEAGNNKGLFVVSLYTLLRGCFFLLIVCFCADVTGSTTLLFSNGK